MVFLRELLTRRRDREKADRKYREAKRAEEECRKQKIKEYHAYKEEMVEKLNPLCAGCRHLRENRGTDFTSYVRYGRSECNFHRCREGGDVYAEGDTCTLWDTYVGCRQCVYCKGPVGTVMGDTELVICTNRNVGKTDWSDSAGCEVFEPCSGDKIVKLKDRCSASVSLDWAKRAEERMRQYKEREENKDEWKDWREHMEKEDLT